MSTDSDGHKDGSETQSEMVVAIEEIASNVIAFCRAVVSKSGMKAKDSS